MFKKISFCVMIVIIMLAFYVSLHLNAWIIERVKKEIISSMNVSSVQIKSLEIGLCGPIILKELVMKKKDGIQVNVDKITLDKGLWSIWEGSNGHARINLFESGKIRLTGVDINFWWKAKELILRINEAKLFEGSLQGEASVRLEQEPSYEVKLKLGNINLVRFAKDFELNKKLSVTGLVQGDIEVQGKGKDFKVINGKLGSLGSGGELVILDTQYLEAMAKRTGQSLDLIVVSLKHYLYNKGAIDIFLNNGNLDLNIAMNGETGKRNLTVVLHDVNLERLGL